MQRPVLIHFSWSNKWEPAHTLCSGDYPIISSISGHVWTGAAIPGILTLPWHFCNHIPKYTHTHHTHTHTPHTHSLHTHTLTHTPHTTHTPHNTHHTHSTHTHHSTHPTTTQHTHTPHNTHHTHTHHTHTHFIHTHTHSTHHTHTHNTTHTTHTHTHPHTPHTTPHSTHTHTTHSLHTPHTHSHTTHTHSLHTHHTPHTHTLTGVEGDELGLDDWKSTPDLFELPLQVKTDCVITVYTDLTQTPSVNTLTATSTWSVPRSFCLWISSKKYLLSFCRL